jgi:nucleotide-binding universal stress UspA family protein
VPAAPGARRRRRGTRAPPRRGAGERSPPAAVRAGDEGAHRDKHQDLLAAEQLRGQEGRWQFGRRDGSIADELIAAAGQIHDGSPGDTAVVVVGGSSQARHHVIGSVSVSLARHARLPIVIVP